jgi:hypothetical protein
MHVVDMVADMLDDSSTVVREETVEITGIHAAALGIIVQKALDPSIYE